jgi:hypothetical protein
LVERGTHHLLGLERRHLACAARGAAAIEARDRFTSFGVSASFIDGAIVFSQVPHVRSPRSTNGLKSSIAFCSSASRSLGFVGARVRRPSMSA